MEEKKESLAEQYFKCICIKSQIEDEIFNAFEKYEPEIYNKPDFGFHTTGDWYDESIEIYFDISLPYPYEPCKEIREVVYNMGFSIVFWNFLKDTIDVPCDEITIPLPDGIRKNSPDEIRGWEPRHNKYSNLKLTDYGYVDDRFNEEEWVKKYKKEGK